jgi:cytochrome c oxidase subunit III
MTEAHITPPTYWPLVGCFALISIATGAVNWLHGHAFGPYLFFLGLIILLLMLRGWFAEVIAENMAGLNDDPREDHSFRLGMLWFIFTEVMFFAAFFGALFYTRVITVPHLGGESYGITTHLLLWPSFKATWPLIHLPDPAQFTLMRKAMGAWGIPAMNTLILLTSGATITLAHWGILKKRHRLAVVGQSLTIVLGLIFLWLQLHEYVEAYQDLGLRLDSGIYGSTFFMLTGFHGLHVTIGTIMLIVILGRILKRHFTPEQHFGFEAVAWYWHFVDVVWLVLYIFVYWL